MEEQRVKPPQTELTLAVHDLRIELQGELANIVDAQKFGLQCLNEGLGDVIRELSSLQESVDSHLKALADESEKQTEWMKEISKALWSVRDYLQIIFPRKA